MCKYTKIDNFFLFFRLYDSTLDKQEPSFNMATKAGIPICIAAKKGDCRRTGKCPCSYHPCYIKNNVPPTYVKEEQHLEKRKKDARRNKPDRHETKPDRRETKPDRHQKGRSDYRPDNRSEKAPVYCPDEPDELRKKYLKYLQENSKPHTQKDIQEYFEYMKNRTLNIVPVVVVPAVEQPVVSTTVQQQQTSFTKDAWNQFIQRFDLNSNDFGQMMLDKFTPWNDYVTQHYDQFNQDLIEFVNVADTKKIQTTTPDWIKTLVQCKALDIQNVRTNIDTLMNIITFGQYLVFKSYMSMDNFDKETFCGLVIVYYGVLRLIEMRKNNTDAKLQIQSFEHINQNVFTGLYNISFDDE